MEQSGLKAPTASSKTFVIMGKTFDPAKPKEYLDSFPIKRT
jgi:nitrate/nitrite transport system substrate-binding protein